jgi:hypothetical protein
VSYQVVLQTPDTGPAKYSHGNGPLPINDALNYSGAPVSEQFSFSGPYTVNGSTHGFRATIQLSDPGILDPDKQYRVTIEEVTA